MNRVLPAGILVNDGVADGAVFIVGLRAAPLYVLNLPRATTFDSVADDGATDQANRRCRGAAVAVADGVADGTTRNGASPAGPAPTMRTSTRICEEADIFTDSQRLD